MFVTEEGLQKIEDELKYLKTAKRKEIAERIHEAKELGDLSENAEYIEAKEEQGFIESRIMELEQMIKNSEMIEHTQNTSVVQIGSTIVVKELVTEQEIEYLIVGSSEANPLQRRISNESPVGQAFLNHNVGDTVIVQTPNGETQYEIVSVK